MVTQKTLNSEKSIIELDGSQMAYVELTDGVSILRFVHQSYGFMGTEEWCKERMETLLEKAKELLPDGGAIIWRHRPEYGENEADDKVHYPYFSYCRFSTSPPLPKEFFDTWGKKEGTPMRTAT